MPKTENVEPRRTKLRTEIDDPREAKQRTDICDPTREKLLSDNALPMCTSSITDKENRDPSRAQPSIDMQEPKRA
jgi:hypothetical protein